MKISNYIGILAIMAFFLSSCGSLSISQKRYSRGLNIGWFSPKEDKGIVQKPIARKTKKKENTEIAQLSPAKAEVLNIEVINESSKSGSLAADVKMSPKMVQAASSKSSHVAKVKTGVKAKVLAIMKSNAGKMMQKAPLKVASSSSVDATNDSDVSLLILIILAFLIPPLAVYLYFGEINIHFWLCLLFCFVGFGILNLYWGFGALYALLTVLGIFG